MPTLDVEFEAFCAKCGWPMGGNVDTRTSRTRRIPQITVAPCERCIDRARDEGYEEGYAKAAGEGAL
jgi:hypothetical protein